METTTTRLALILPTPLKRKFKIACVSQGVEMSDIVRDFIEQWLKDQEKGRK